MKSQAKSYLIMLTLAASTVLAGCATGPSPEARSNAADRVLAAYEVPDLLAQAGPAVAQSLDKNLPDDIGTAERQRLRSAIRSAYDPQVLQRDVVERLQNKATEGNHAADLVKAADTLDQPLPSRMIALESTTGSSDFAQGFESFVNQPATEQRKQRLREIDTLAQNLQIIELQTEFNSTLLESMIRARNAAVATEERVDDARIEQMISTTRSDIGSKLEQRVPLMLLYVYRDVSDAKLAEYAQLQGRADMAWTNRALKESIIGTLEAAGDRLVENYNSAS